MKHGTVASVPRLKGAHALAFIAGEKKSAIQTKFFMVFKLRTSVACAVYKNMLHIDYMLLRYAPSCIKHTLSNMLTYYLI